MSKKIGAEKTQKPDVSMREAVIEPCMAEEVRDRWIAVAAYYRAAQRGFTENRELDDWLEAEREFNDLL